MTTYVMSSRMITADDKVTHELIFGLFRETIKRAAIWDAYRELTTALRQLGGHVDIDSDLRRFQSYQLHRTTTAGDELCVDDFLNLVRLLQLRGGVGGQLEQKLFGRPRRPGHQQALNDLADQIKVYLVEP